MAIAKCMEYKAVVTRGRVNKYIRAAWILALLIVVPLVIIGAVGVPYELIAELRRPEGPPSGAP